jgi:hypothetical protein
MSDEHSRTLRHAQDLAITIAASVLDRLIFDLMNDTPQRRRHLEFIHFLNTARCRHFTLSHRPRLPGA